MKTEEEIRKRLEFLEDIKSNFLQLHQKGITFAKKKRICQEILILKEILELVEEKNPELSKKINMSMNETMEEKVIRVFQKDNTPKTPMDLSLILGNDYSFISGILRRLVQADRFTIVGGNGFKSSPKFYCIKEKK